MATYYSEEHEWLTVEGDTATLGITAHAAEQLGEVVFVEQQDAGEEFAKDGEIGVIESVKAASEALCAGRWRDHRGQRSAGRQPRRAERRPRGRGLDLQDQDRGRVAAGRSDGRSRLQGLHRVTLTGGAFLGSAFPFHPEPLIWAPPVRA